MALTEDERAAVNQLIRQHNQFTEHYEAMVKVFTATIDQTWYLRLYFWLRPPAWPNYKRKVIRPLRGDLMVPEPVDEWRADDPDRGIATREQRHSIRQRATTVAIHRETPNENTAIRPNMLPSGETDRA
jgi:hypothetical protein